MELSLQGTLIAGANVLYTCPVGKTAKIITIKFNNPAAYTLSLSKYDAALANTVTVYTYNLAAGDTVIDSSVYTMFAGDYISVTTSVGGTDYLMYLVEIP